MLKYKHNTFKRKIKVYTKAFYKNKWYVKRNKLLEKQSNANGILPNSLNIAKLLLVLLAPSIFPSMFSPTVELERYACVLRLLSMKETCQNLVRSVVQREDLQIEKENTGKENRMLN
jgi:hypothetical protein